MGGTQLHSPQSVFQHTMSHHSTNLQNEAQWFGTPQVPPMSMPWSLPASQKPDLVYFTAKQNFALGKGHIKRKLETPDLVEMRPRKQLITEEKMAQQFRGLHISNNSMNLQEAGPSTSTISSSNQSNTLDLDLTSSLGDKNNFEPRLVISDEIKRLQQEPILPTSLVTQSLSKLERPTMALVLWEPSSRHFPNFPRETPTPVSSSDDNNNNNNNNNVNSGNINNENNSNNNNNESIPDLNQAMTASGTIQSLEPMDL